MLCKEQGITVIAIWVLCDIFHIASSVSLDRNDDESSVSPLQKTIFKCLKQCPRHIFTCAALVATLYFRTWINGGYAPIVFSRAENPAAVEKALTTRALSFFYINMLNIWVTLLLYMHVA